MSGKMNMNLPPFSKKPDGSTPTLLSPKDTGSLPKKRRRKKERKREAPVASSDNITDRIRKLFSSEVYSDVEFVLRGSKDSTKSVFPAHRNILAIGSPIFAEMLYSDSTRNLQCFPMSVEIENLPYETFGNIIEYLYTDDVYLESLSEAIETLLAARRFEVQALIKRCEKYIDTEPLHAENVCTTLQEALINQVDPLTERCMAFIQEHTRNVIQSSDFLKSSVTTMKKMCAAPKLSLKSEVELFEALMRWSDEPKGRKVFNWAPHYIHLIIFKNIRFLTMSSTEFGNLLRRYPGFLPEKEALSVLLHLINPHEQQSLPRWCNKESNRCYLLNSPPDNTQENKMPNEPTAGDFNPNNIYIALKDSNRKQKGVPALTSILEAKCVRGKYRLKSISLEFNEPITEDSSMDVTVLITVMPSMYQYHESFPISNLKSVCFNVDHKIMFGKNDKLDLRINATNIKNYIFKKFDAVNSFSQMNSPFECKASSLPSDDQLFFIKGISFEKITYGHFNYKNSAYYASRGMN